MAATSLLALIDDIASVLDDVAVLTKVATKKTAGVLGDEKTPAMIRKQLDSSSDREKLDAMKRLVAVSVPFAVHTQPKHPFYLLVYRLPAQIASY